MPKKIEISHRTIIFTVFFLLSLWVLFQIRQIIVILFVAIIIMSALNPAVDRLERIRLPRWLAILLLYILIFGGFGVILGILIPPLVEQTTLFVNRISFFLRETKLGGIDPNVITQQVSQIGLFQTDILKATFGFFSNLIGIVFLAVVSFHLLLQRKNLNRYFLVLFGEGKEKIAEDFVNKIEKRIGGWVRGELVLMIIIGVMSYIGLRLLGIDLALPLALLAGLLEILPNIGPLIAAIPAVLMGLTISPLMGLAVVALYFLVQQIENSFVVPRVMQKAVGLSPLITILALAIGFKVSGVVGAILAVPLVLVFQTVASEIFSSSRFKNL